MSLPGAAWLAKKLILGCCPPFSQRPLPVHHLICLDREPQSLLNLTVFSSLLPLYSIAGCDYQVAFLYDYPSELPAQAALPCYLVFSQWVVFLSQNADIALACFDWNTVYSFRERFASLERQAESLEVSPCPELSFLYEESPSKPILISSRPFFSLSAPAAKSKEAAPRPLYFFTRRGLAGFCQDGVPFRFPGVFPPQAALKPIPLPRRLGLLKELWNDLAQEPARCFMLRSELFSLADGFCCCFNSRRGAQFSFFPDLSGPARTVRLPEGSLWDALEDFFSYLPGSPLACSRQEALLAIQEEARQLGKRVPQETNGF